MKTIKKIATEELIQSAKTLRFKTNENKTKYICVTREKPQLYQKINIKIGEYTFEKV